MSELLAIRLMPLDEDGAPASMPKADETVHTEHHACSASTRATLDPEPPVPPTTITDTLK